MKEFSSSSNFVQYKKYFLSFFLYICLFLLFSQHSIVNGQIIATSLMTNNYAFGISMATDGTFYFSNLQNHTIWKRSTTGILTKICGISGNAAASGDNVVASSSSINGPYALFVTTSSQVYFAELFNNKVRLISSSGILTTIAGTGTAGYSGDGGPASSAAISGPWGVWIDSANNLFISEYNGNKIRRVVLSTGIISLVAGGNTVTATGAYSGDGGVASSALINQPRGVWGDTAGQYLYFSDRGNSRVRRIDRSTNIITTYACTGVVDTTVSGDGGPATSAGCNSVIGIFVDTNGNLYLSDASAGRIRVVTPQGIIALVAGSTAGGTVSSGDGGPATSAVLVLPRVPFIDTIGNLYVSEYYPPNRYSVRRIYDSTPTRSPTQLPSVSPTFIPSQNPTFVPTPAPTLMPTRVPTFVPTIAPSVIPSTVPSFAPSLAPSIAPSLTPTQIPTRVPTVNPTLNPTVVPSILPSAAPSLIPTVNPSLLPTLQPTCAPTLSPTCSPTALPTFFPTCVPSLIPSAAPSFAPSNTPSVLPTIIPTQIPSNFPTLLPTVLPSVVPTTLPTTFPTATPSVLPTVLPSVDPSAAPTAVPTIVPSVVPSVIPSTLPTTLPTATPSVLPTMLPSVDPSAVPTVAPTTFPTGSPSSAPTHIPTAVPSIIPSVAPTEMPSAVPTGAPTEIPSISPTVAPTISPTTSPSVEPTELPTTFPSAIPTEFPTVHPTTAPSPAPTLDPSEAPSLTPSAAPTAAPSLEPTTLPSVLPTAFPSEIPTTSPSETPSTNPSAAPTFVPTEEPSWLPSATPSASPSIAPTVAPTFEPSEIPTESPSIKPTQEPSQDPTLSPTYFPTVIPSSSPTVIPSTEPTLEPSLIPTANPSEYPTETPSHQPTIKPSSAPSMNPSVAPTIIPSTLPTVAPTLSPTALPSVFPSEFPTVQPTVEPSTLPSPCPTVEPSSIPSHYPTVEPTTLPSFIPSSGPSVLPSQVPTIVPSAIPSTFPSIVFTSEPTLHPTVIPSTEPTYEPSFIPTFSPTISPSLMPSLEPTLVPSILPSQAPTLCPSLKPSHNPTILPSLSPSREPSIVPTPIPNSVPTMVPTAVPTITPSTAPTVNPSLEPTAIPTSKTPTLSPTLVPTLSPSIVSPTTAVSFECTGSKSNVPRIMSSSSSTKSQSLCLNLVLDLASTGLSSCGQLWSSREVSVVCSNASSACAPLRDLISNQWYALTTSSSSSMLVIDSTSVRNTNVTGSMGMMEISSITCNYLNYCAKTTIGVQFDDSSVFDPVVVIAGSTVRKMMRTQSLSLSASYYVPECGGNQRTKGVRLSWSCVDSITGAVSTGCKSISTDTSKFVISKNQLQSGVKYNISVIATDSATSRQSVTSVIVDVEIMPLQPVIQPVGERQVVRLGESLVLDASQSYDPNFDSPSSSSLTYAWSCTSSSGDTCLLSLQSPSTVSMVTISVSNSDAVGQSYFVDLLISSPTASPVTKTVEIVVVAASAPRVSFAAAESEYSHIDTKKRLSIPAEVQTTVPCESSWSLTTADGDSVVSDLQSVALLPTQKSVAGGSTDSVSMSLLLSANVLQSGMQYLFTLQCGSTSNSMVVTTNSPPSDGSFFLNPMIGSELSTTFYFQCRDWLDVDLPLSYEFAFLSPSNGGKLSIRDKAELSSAQSQLPAGSRLKEFALDTILQVFDSLDCATQRQVVTVTVNEMESSALLESVAASIDQLLLSISSDGSVSADSLSTEEIQRTVALAGAALNKINCTRAPDCINTLHRDACSVKDHTCGNCLSGYFGDNGPSNQPCMSEEELVGLNMASVDDLSSFQKSCSSMCLENGVCQFLDKSSGDEVASCGLFDVTCEAVCVCNDDSGYSGSECDQRIADLERSQLMRRSLLQAIDSLPLADSEEGNDATVYAASNRASMMRSVLSDSSDAIDSSDTSIALVSNMAETLLSSLLSTSSSSSSSVEEIISGDVAAVANVILGVSMNSLRSSDNIDSSASSSSILSMLLSMGDVSMRSQSQSLVGSDATTVVADSFRVATIANAGGSDVEISLPVNDLERLVGVSGAAITVDSDSTSASSTVALQVLQTPSLLWSTSLHANTTPVSLLSNALTLRLSASQNSNAPYRMQVKVPITSGKSSLSTVVAVANVAPAVFTTNCSMMEVKVDTYFCSDSNITLTHACSGEKDEQFVSICPTLQPVCHVVTDASTVAECNMTSIDVSGGFMVCDCILTVLESDRRLSGDSLSSSNAMTLLGITEYVGKDVAKTFIASKTLTNIQSAEQVMVVLSLFVAVWTIGSMLIGYIHWNKNIRYRKKKKAVQGLREAFRHHQHANRRVDKKGGDDSDSAEEESEEDEVEIVENGNDRRRKVLAKAIRNKRLDELENDEDDQDDIDKTSPELVMRLLSNYLATVIPRAFSSKSILLRMKEEIMRHHPYLRLLNVKDSDRSPILATIHMLTVQSLMMFVLALLYDLQCPDDDGSCVPHTDESSCLTRRSLFDADQSYCHWNTDSSVTGKCEYADPVFSWTVGVYCAVLISVVTALINWPIDYMFTVLSAPIAHTVQAQIVATQMNARARRSSVAALPAGVNIPVNGAVTRRAAVLGGIRPPAAVSTIAPIDSTGVVKTKAGRRNSSEKGGRLEIKFIPEQLRDAQDVAKSAMKKHSSFRDLLTGSSNTVSKEDHLAASAPMFDTVSVFYRQRMQPMGRSADKESIRRFTEQWGISPYTGKVYEIAPLPRTITHGRDGANSVADMIATSLSVIEDTAQEEIKYLKQVPTESQRGVEVIQLFIQDLLGYDTVAARIYSAKVNEDYRSFPAVTRWHKIVAVILLVALNLLFAYYTMLKGYVKGRSWQRSFLVACLVQFVIEILLFATMECLYFHCFVPSLVSSELQKIQLILRETIHTIAFSSATQSPKKTESLNAPDYFFVSHHVAKTFPTLFESSLVLSYRSLLPGEISEKWKAAYHWSKGQEMKEMRNWGNDGNTLAHSPSMLSANTSSTSSLPLSSSNGSPVPTQATPNNVKLLQTIDRWVWNVFISLTIFLAYIVAAVPFDLQRAILRFAQPFLLGGLVFAWYKIRENDVYFALFIVFIALVALALLAQHFLRQRLLRKSRSHAFAVITPAPPQDQADAVLVQSPGRQSSGSSSSVLSVGFRVNECDDEGKKDDGNDKDKDDIESSSIQSVSASSFSLSSYSHSHSQSYLVDAPVKPSCKQYSKGNINRDDAQTRDSDTESHGEVSSASSSDSSDA